MPYIALHNHSCYSMLDSGCRVEELVATAAADGMPALALTDHCIISGAVEFVQRCAEAGIRPIIGSELIVEGDLPLVLLCESDEGYRHLSELLTRGTHEYRPVPWRRVQRLSGGLIALSAGRDGELGRLAAGGDVENAVRRARFFAQIFPGRFYIELFHHQPADRVLAIRLRKVAEELGLPMVAAPNTHYLAPGDRRLYEVLSSIGTLTLLGEEHPAKKEAGEYHFRTSAEMRRLFGDIPEALENTARVAARCHLSIFEEVARL